MQKAYNKIGFENKPSTKTPLNAETLGLIDNGIDVIDDRVIELDGDVNVIEEIATENVDISKSTIQGQYGVIPNRIYTVTNLISKNVYIDSIELTSKSSTSFEEYLYYISIDGEILGKWLLESGVTSIDVKFLTPKKGYFAYHSIKSSASGVIKYTAKPGVTDDSAETLVKSYFANATEIKEIGESITFVATPIELYFNLNITGIKLKSGIATPYQNKNISFLGDSITQGWSGEEGVYASKPYPMTVAEDLDCKTQNAGYGGYTVAAIDNVGSLSKIYSSVISSDADYVVVFGGTNDYFYGVEIGTIDDRDNSTFYGAVYTLINGITTNFPNAEVIFCTPIHRSNESANSSGYTLSDYVNAIKEMCGLCGIKVIDLHNESGFSYLVDAFKPYYTDGLHLTQEGYTRLGHVISRALTVR